jgi:hypothetical protein
VSAIRSREVSQLYKVATIVASDRAKIPTVDSMWRTGATSCRLLVKNYVGAVRCKLRANVVEGVVLLCLCGQFGIDTGASE